MILCHSFVAIDLCVFEMELRMSNSRAPRCSGRKMVFSMVSMSQPKIILLVVQHASPIFNFLTEADSCQKLVSFSSRGRKTLSSTCNRIRLTARRCHLLPCMLFSRFHDLFQTYFLSHALLVLLALLSFYIFM